MKRLFLILNFLFVILISSLYTNISPPKFNAINVSNSIDNNELIKNKINNMTLDEKIGQLIICGFDGYTLDNNFKNLIKENHLGGVILFSKNIKNSDGLINLINSLKETNSSNKIPLFISVDEEGGPVSRMPNEIYDIPSNKYIGQINNEDFSYEIGKLLGKQLSAFGFNLNFAPVLDINSNPNNPVIGIRSFGNDKDLVSKLGVKVINGIKEENIIPVAKHFPGHGDTSVDSHLNLPVVNHDFNRLNNFELIPFKEAIKNGVDAIMVAHILLPKLDKNNPATLSKTIITDILRNKLNFNGLILTDDMTMGAITENYNIGDAAVKSINAGSDIILVCHETNNINTVINSIKLAVSKNIITESRINESVYRILSTKEKFNLNNNTIDFVDIKSINYEVNKVLQKYKK